MARKEFEPDKSSVAWKFRTLHNAIDHTLIATNGLLEVQEELVRIAACNPTWSEAIEFILRTLNSIADEIYTAQNDIAIVNVQLGNESEEK